MRKLSFSSGQQAGKDSKRTYFIIRPISKKILSQIFVKNTVTTKQKLVARGYYGLCSNSSIGVRRKHKTKGTLWTVVVVCVIENASTSCPPSILHPSSTFLCVLIVPCDSDQKKKGPS
jgi:hypothetical protein